MHIRYDSVACAADLIPKVFIIDNVVSGWRPSGRGELPKPAVFAWRGLSQATVSERQVAGVLARTVSLPDEVAVQKSAEKQATLVLYDIAESVEGRAVCCYNEIRRVVHLTSNFNASLCGNVVLRREGKLSAGMVVSKRKVSEFADDTEYEFCRSCFGRCLSRVSGSVPSAVCEPRETVGSPSSGSSAASESDSWAGSDA